MEENRFFVPEPERMEELLAAHPGDAPGVILRLAWRAGLKRKEISALTWPQVDRSADLLRLPDREVPAERELLDCLERWRNRPSAVPSAFVVSSGRRSRMAEQSISRLARSALDSVGLTEIRLVDLRHDFVRRQLERWDWPYVLRISGISVSTYRNSIAGLVTVGEQTPEPQADPAEESRRLRDVMEREGSSAAGIALRLSVQLGLRNEEIVRLTWETVDLEGGVLLLPDGTVHLPENVANVLREVREHRSPEDDPHLLLTSQTRKPMTAEWLNTLVRTALIRGGIENRLPGDLCMDREIAAEKRRLTDYAGEHGSISRGEAMRLLDVSESVAYYRLKTLTESGELVRVNSRYYPAGKVVPPERQREAICQYLSESGPAYLQEIVDLLHIGKRTASRLLRMMVEERSLVLLPRTKRYALPEPAAKTEAFLFQ